MKILIAYDGSDHSKKAVFFTLNFIKKEDEIYLVTVIKEAPKSPEQKIIQAREEAEQKQKEVLKDLEGYKVTAEILESPDVSSALIEYCKKVNCNMIVTGSRGLTGLKKAILGSVSSELVSKSDIPVLVVK
ncbi:universal stress protein [Sulfurisphaera javensis]|uniref:Universal stress protein n=1 Tax=Sulfurisphaera javensis TaxID=2049879 RepID=A0AAT9GPN5_9CREN